MIGQFISHYKILEKLGAGGMGVVYKAEDTKLKRIVALKFLPPELTRDEEAKKRFLHEARAAATLDHPNICTVHEIGETEDGQMFIAMGYYEGKTLKEKLTSHPLPLTEAVDIAIQIAAGLNAAHKKNIVHRDIKSANIIITPEGTAKILDFGLAKLKGQTKLTKEGSTLGTIDYMSPEQATGDKVDHRTDIWSQGVMLYEMITGRVPFKGEYEQAIVYSIINAEPEPVTGLRTGIPMELERIINKTLAKEPSDRYQHADDMIVDLKKVKKDSETEIIPSKKNTGTETVIKISPKHKIASFFLLIAIVIIAGYFIFRGQPGHELPFTEHDGKPSLAIVYFENNTGDKDLDHWRKALSEMLIADLSQSRLLRVLPGDRLYQILKELDQLETSSYSTKVLNQIANKGGVNHIIRGSFTKADQQFRINIMIRDATGGSIIASDRVEGEGVKSFFPMIDKLTKKIKINFDLPKKDIEEDIDKGIGTITTSSPEAMKFFIEGLRYLYQADFKLSVQFMKKAIDIDPEFAYAFLMKGFGHQSIGYISESKKNFRKAFELRDKVSEKEYYLILGSFYGFSIQDNTRAIEALKKLLELYPDNIYGNNILAYIYYSIEQFDSAAIHYKRNVKNKANIFYTYYMLARTLMAKGEYDQAVDICEFYIQNITDHPELRFNLAINYFCQGKYDMAIKNAGKADELGFRDTRYSYLVKGAVFQSQGKPGPAEQEYKMMTRMTDVISGIQGRANLGVLYLLQGKYNKSTERIREAINLNENSNIHKSRLHNHYAILVYLLLRSGKTQEALIECNKKWKNTSGLRLKRFNPGYALYLKGLANLRMKQLTGAEESAETLKKIIRKEFYKNDQRDYLHLLGEIELYRGNLTKSITRFKEAKSLLPCQVQDDLSGYFHRTLFYNSLGGAYFKAGMLKEAKNEYEEITRLTIGRHHFGDLYVLSFYKLGIINEQLGEREKALHNFYRFLDLWKDADSGIPEIEDARKRVQELGGKNNS